MRLSSIVGAAVLAAACTIAAQPAEAQTDFVLKSLKFRSRQYNAATGTLTVKGGTITGTLAGLPFTTDITNFVLQLVPDDLATPGEECAILDLQLGPININLLGLHVDTSAICLEITAFRGGGLLGDLLCGLAGGNFGLLNSPDLLSGLSDILNTALGQAEAAPAQAPDSVCTGDCVVLNLVLGPLTLNLLGVQVVLDNCDEGPVQICVSATAGEGLLGDLLCGLAGGGALQGITAADQLELIGRLVD